MDAIKYEASSMLRPNGTMISLVTRRWNGTRDRSAIPAHYDRTTRSACYRHLVSTCQQAAGGQLALQHQHVYSRNFFGAVFSTNSQRLSSALSAKFSPVCVAKSFPSSHVNCLREKLHPFWAVTNPSPHWTYTSTGPPRIHFHSSMNV